MTGSLKCSIPALATLTKLSLMLAALWLSGCSGGSNIKDDEPAIVEQPQQPVQAITTELSASDRAELQKLIPLLDSDQNNKVLKSLKALYKRNPNNPETGANYAVALYKTGDSKSAERIAKKFPSSALAHNTLGVVSLEAGRVADADAHFQKAIAQNDKYALAYYNLALIYETYYQDLRNAIKMYQSYLLLTDLSDKETQTWVAELEASL